MVGTGGLLAMNLDALERNRILLGVFLIALGWSVPFGPTAYRGAVMLVSLGVILVSLFTQLRNPPSLLRVPDYELGDRVTLIAAAASAIGLGIYVFSSDDGSAVSMMPPMMAVIALPRPRKPMKS
jgi:hypothetical protein